jgi:hypothetical protein
MNISYLLEECIEEEVKPKKTFLDNFLTSPSPSKTAKRKTEAEKQEVKGQEVKVTDFFGKSSIHRVERKIIHVERKPEKV